MTAASLERRPGYGGPVLARLRVPTCRDETVNAASGRVHFRCTQQRAQLFAQCLVETDPQLLQRVNRVLLDLLAAPTPEQGAQLVVDGEAHAVVDTEDVSVRR